MNKSALLISLALAGCGARNSMENWTGELRNGFTYKGNEIPPLVIKEFCCWISDSKPQICAIDLETSIGSNRYYGSIERSGEWIESRLYDDNNNAYGFVMYKVEKYDNEKFYLTVCENGGGSSSFRWNIFVHGETWSPLIGEMDNRNMLILDGHK